jgi:hypothetical protein
MVKMEQWIRFCQAFGGMMSSEFYAEQYPDHIRLTESENPEDGIEYIKTIVNKAIDEDRLNPTECLVVFVKICLDNSKYAEECSLDIEAVLDKCMKSGAQFPYDLIFKPTFSGEANFLEEECANHNVRSIMIDFLKPEPDIAYRYAYWPAIPATYWEDIECNDDWRQNLKFCSEYLQSLK